MPEGYSEDVYDVVYTNYTAIETSSMGRSKQQRSNIITIMMMMIIIIIITIHLRMCAHWFRTRPSQLCSARCLSFRLGRAHRALAPQPDEQAMADKN